MALQDKYPLRQDAYIVGMVPNSRPKDVLSQIVADAAGIGFGLAVFRHANGDKSVTQTQNAKFIGITIKDVTLVPLATTEVDKYLQGQNCAVIVEGPIVVLNGAATVVVDDPVYLTAGGAFTNVSTSNTLITGAKFGSSAAAAKPVVVVLGA